jgi:predicted DNA-binding antitoxin AbrB/MazE fold protein
MSMVLSARYVNGVFVPSEKPPLSENAEVTLHVEAPQDYDREAALRMIEETARNRIQIDQEVAKKIATDPAYNIENW